MHLQMENEQTNEMTLETLGKLATCHHLFTPHLNLTFRDLTTPIRASVKYW